MRQYLKDNNSKLIYFYMVDSTDHVTPKTGLTLTVRVSKNGAAFGAGGGSVVELETGWYAYTPSVGDINTLGPIGLKATATGADVCNIEGVVVAYDPYTAGVDVTKILGSSLVESDDGQVALGLSEFFDVETPAKDINDIGAVTLTDEQATALATSIAGGLVDQDGEAGDGKIRLDANGNVYTVNNNNEMYKG